MSLLLTGTTLRRLVCLGATFSATTNPFPILASPRARDGDSLELLLNGELGELATAVPRVLDLAIADAERVQRVGADAVEARRPRALAGVAGRPRASGSRVKVDSAGRLPLELDVSLLSTFDALSASARSTASAPELELAASSQHHSHRNRAFRDIAIRKPWSPRPSRNATLARTSTLRVGTSSRPRPPNVRALSTLRPTPAPQRPSLSSHEQGSADPGAPPPPALAKSAPAEDVRSRGLATGPSGKAAQVKEDVKPDIGDRPIIPNQQEGGSTSQPGTPYLDELNTLLRHPTLYDPILAPRHPIVLCHGLYGFDVRGPGFFRLHYWGDLLKILRGKIGAEVFVTAVPGTGAVKERAHVLHDALQGTEGLLGRDLNFIAHSMGGLDARYLLSKIKPTTYNPRSLTTISTPHRGSEFMSWCRVNIGIGTDFDRTSEHAARLLHEDESMSLPYSLKAPILSRAQVEAAREAVEAAKKAKDAADKVKANFPGLPYSLSASLSGYLLDLLDSPAYANLTPSFLRDVFNPQTPDRPDIRYFSVAARTEKISIWHPLWLPKVVLDGAQAAREAKGIFPADPRWRGNDGLVNVESAQWGEFLGVLETCDHWEVRGSSGLVNAVASAKAVAEATNIGSKEEVDEGRQAAKGTKPGWKWQDVYALVGIQSKESTAEAKSPAVEAESDAPKRDAKVDEETSLTALASWIVHSLPGVPDPSTTPSATSKPPPSTASVFPSDSATTSSTSDLLTPHALASSPLAGSPNPRQSTTGPSDPGLQAARMLYGAPKSTAQPEKFNLERMALALCRKLHNEGL